MKKRTKKILIWIFSVILILSLSVIGGLRYFFSSFKPTCETKDVWHIENYTIQHSRCIGPFGPHYSSFDIYKNKDHISKAFKVSNDSCRLRARVRNDYYLDFNICKETLLIRKPDKRLIDIETIDSILIRPFDSVRLVRTDKKYPEPLYDTVFIANFDSTVTKRLKTKEIKDFVNRWNKSKSNGFERLVKNYDYLLIIYSNDSIRKIKSLNHFLTENELWSYESTKDDFYDKLWIDK
jgi:hypothetical protein